MLQIVILNQKKPCPLAPGSPACFGAGRTALTKSASYKAGHMDARDLIKALQNILQRRGRPHLGNVGDSYLNVPRTRDTFIRSPLNCSSNGVVTNLRWVNKMRWVVVFMLQESFRNLCGMIVSASEVTGNSFQLTSSWYSVRIFNLLPHKQVKKRPSVWDSPIKCISVGIVLLSSILLAIRFNFLITLPTPGNRLEIANKCLIYLMLNACLSGYHPHPLYVVCLFALQARAAAGALRRRSG